MKSSNILDSDLILNAETLIGKSIIEMVKKTDFEIGENNILTIKIDCKNGSELGGTQILLPSNFELEPQKESLAIKLLDMMVQYTKIIMTELTAVQLAQIKLLVDTELDSNSNINNSHIFANAFKSLHGTELDFSITKTEKRKRGRPKKIIDIIQPLEKSN